tara:strand:- start:52 stop:246 length:195 start_codon:yes stop_codon:yes gene_type:complete
VRDIFIDALVKKYEAEIAESKATLTIYLTNSVGIGEHPQHIEEMDKILNKIADAEHKLQIIKNI